MTTKTYRFLPALFLPMGLAASAAPPLPAEPIPAVAPLPAQSAHWLYAHDAAFYSLTSGKVFVVDVGAESRNVLGLIGAAQFPSFRQSRTRDELYVAT